MADILREIVCIKYPQPVFLGICSFNPSWPMVTLDDDYWRFLGILQNIFDEWQEARVDIDYMVPICIQFGLRC